MVASSSEALVRFLTFSSFFSQFSPISRSLTQKRFLEEMIGCTSSWKVLVMDEQATRIISSALTMYDIMEQRVTIVEQLGLARAPFPEMDVLYFCSPTKEAINKIIDDFKDNPKYGTVHLFFTDALGEEFNLLQSCPKLVSRVKTLKELSLEYLAVEANSFHLDLKTCLPMIYGSSPDPMLSNIVARKLSTMCISLNEHPNIRYQGSSKFCKAVALGVHEYIKAFKRANPTATFNGDDHHEDRERGQLLILDRTFDPLAPLMHEYTYQAMAYDLLPVQGDNLIDYSSTNNKGETETKTAVLGEHDDLWCEFRHKHIAKVIDSLKVRMNDIVQNNAGAALAKKSGANMKITQMASAVKSLPEYQQIMARLSQHVAIASMCMGEFTNQNLMNVSECEQKVGTGTDDNGKEIKGKLLFQDVLKALGDMKNSQKALKKRLVAIYIVSQRSAGLQEKQSLIQAAGLSAADNQFLMNLDALCSKAIKSDPVAEQTMQSRGKSMINSFFGNTKKKQEHAATAEGEYTDSRFVGAIKALLEQLISSDLPADKYPSLGPTISSSNDARSAAKSVRRFGANNRWGKKESTISGGRYMCFVAGGITYSEMRAAYELQAQHSKEVVVGGTHFVNSAEYIKEITSLAG